MDTKSPSHNLLGKVFNKFPLKYRISACQHRETEDGEIMESTIDKLLLRNAYAN